MTSEIAYLWRLRATMRRQRREIRFYRALIIVLTGAVCFQLFR